MVTSPTPTATQHSSLTITWEPLPDDFQLDDTPVENTGQPLIAGALRESLELANYIQPQMLIASNFGLCATVNQELVIKAPDWVYVSRVLEPGKERKSYTPHLEGDIPTVVMEFLSETEGGEYSVKRTPPLGKWFFYEQVLNVPVYIIFEPATGLLEVYRFTAGRYELEQPNYDGRHWLAEMQLFLGTWRGTKEERTGYWLRWWTEAGDLLPWAVEQIEQERQRAEQEKQRAEQERQRAEQERQRADRLATYLRSQGINPDEVD
ncbi:Uma2 family endonuclease [Pantanalinema rosaneae CENA516]|uniref:Uma2 family endonuclease n=1 Tax=Pantanalinema rosaneae TaxID=1620701 RepID=UPI003D6ECB88